MILNKNYWEKRYHENEIGWDAGSITTPIQSYIDQLTDKNIKILIPGAGNGYEFTYLIESGFTNVYVIDIASQPIENLRKKHPNFKENILLGDFFELKDTFDLIIEQTFFCALNPDLRTKYALKTHELLNRKRKISGLLFDFPLTEVGPPFGGNKKEYTALFKTYFTIKTLNLAYNSIKPRKDKELFFIFEKK